MVCGVRRDWIGAGLGAGMLAAAATVGALVGAGIRVGTPARPLNAIAAVLLGQNAQGTWGFTAVTAAGLALHLAATLLLALLFAWLVTRTGGRAWLWGAIFGAAWLVGAWLVARVLGVGPGTLLPLGDRILLAALLALALPLGMRLALPGQREL